MGKAYRGLVFAVALALVASPLVGCRKRCQRCMAGGAAGPSGNPNAGPMAPGPNHDGAGRGREVAPAPREVVPRPEPRPGGESLVPPPGSDAAPVPSPDGSTTPPTDPPTDTPTGTPEVTEEPTTPVIDPATRPEVTRCSVAAITAFKTANPTEPPAPNAAQNAESLALFCIARFPTGNAPAPCPTGLPTWTATAADPLPSPNPNQAILDRFNAAKGTGMGPDNRWPKLAGGATLQHCAVEAIREVPEGQRNAAVTALRSLVLMDNRLVNTPNEDGYTPLMTAVQIGSVDAVREIQGRGADPNARASLAPPATGPDESKPSTIQLALNNVLHLRNENAVNVLEAVLTSSMVPVKLRPLLDARVRPAGVTASVTALQAFGSGIPRTAPTAAAEAAAFRRAVQLLRQAETRAREGVDPATRPEVGAWIPAEARAWLDEPAPPP